MGTLFVVATPIGNMNDISRRAIQVLGEVDLIAAEDTRHTGRLLQRLGVRTPMVSYHEFNERQRVDRILEALESGSVALVTDAGTPGVSDPGAILVRAAADAGHSVVPVPGPSAAIAAVSASGLVDGPFTFVGFLPRQPNRRSEALAGMLGLGMPLVIFESGQRIVDLLISIANLSPDRDITVFRELTKLHETSYRGHAAALASEFGAAATKGEFVLVVGPGSKPEQGDIDALIVEELAAGERPSEIARSIARSSGISRSDVYARVLELARRAEPSE